MHLTLHEAAGRLNDLAARADAGEDVVLTRTGAPPLRLSVAHETVQERRRRALSEHWGAWKGLPQFDGATAATLSDELYDEHGLPK